MEGKVILALAPLHMAVGFGIGYGGAALFKEKRQSARVAWGLLGSIWAILPDLYMVSTGVHPPDTPFMDVFFFHNALDKLENQYEARASSLLSQVLVFSG
jgi:hypothetical protein